ncbi:MAG: copper chaperone PCu(A)C [Zoogloea sp.]|nr:copper chaperone PCu(A)C [Zoogloea sp.]
MKLSALIARSVAVALAGLCATAAFAADIEVANPWVRGTVAAQKATGAFMQLSSKGGVSLVGVESPAANIVELHEMVMADNVMKMRALPRLDVKPGQPLELKPGSYHVMLIDLKKPLTKGDVVPITLKVEGKDKKVENVEVKAEVRDLTAAAPMPMDHKHNH